MKIRPLVIKRGESFYPSTPGKKEIFTSGAISLFFEAQTRDLFNQQRGGAYTFHRLSLEKDERGAWQLVIAETTNATILEPEYNVTFAGFNWAEAVEFLVQRVIELNDKLSVEMKSLLEKVLRETYVF